MWHDWDVWRDCDVRSPLRLYNQTHGSLLQVEDQWSVPVFSAGDKQKEERTLVPAHNTSAYIPETTRKSSV